MPPGSSFIHNVRVSINNLARDQARPAYDGATPTVPNCVEAITFFRKIVPYLERNDVKE